MYSLLNGEDKSSSLEHDRVPQFLDSSYVILELKKQYFPPLLGAGLVQFRLRILVPVPQVTGHALQGSHADQLPLTKIMNTEFKKCIPKVFAIVGVGNAKFEQGRAYEHGHIFGDSKKIYFGFWENCKLRSVSFLFVPCKILTCYHWLQHLQKVWRKSRDYFSTDKALRTGYDIYLLCALIADPVTLLAIFLLNFGRQDALQKVAILQKKIALVHQSLLVSLSLSMLCGFS